MVVVEERRDWWESAACLEADPELFFPVAAHGPGARELARAKAVCAACRVRRQCLQYALATHQLHGVWGGTSEDERQLHARRERERGREREPKGAPLSWTEERRGKDRRGPERPEASAGNTSAGNTSAGNTGARRGPSRAGTGRGAGSAAPVLYDSAFHPLTISQASPAAARRTRPPGSE